MRDFIEGHFGDLVGLWLIVMGFGGAFLTAWKFNGDPQHRLFAMCIGMISAGTLALKLSYRPTGGNGKTTTDTTTVSATHEVTPVSPVPAPSEQKATDAPLPPVVK